MLAAAWTSLPADDNSAPVNEAYLREHYTKSEHMVPMRDGVKLFVALYSPKDTSQPYPILLTRTPYGSRPYGVENVPDPGWPMGHLAREKFIFAIQDVRGRNASEGEFVHMRPQRPRGSSPAEVDESTDAHDTIEWLVHHAQNNNGKVGMMGISYPGFYTAAGMINSHPALRCASPQAPIADWFVGDDFHHNGAFYLPHAFRFLSQFGQALEDPIRDNPRPFQFKTPDGYEFYLGLGPLTNADARHFKGRIAFWRELMEHGAYDEFWQQRNLRSHLNGVKAAVMTVGGWFDAEDLFGPLQIYREVERRNPGTFNMIVLGPWSHGGWSRGDGDHLGSVRFFARTSEYYRKEIEIPFLRKFLKDDAGVQLPEAIVFETGTCQWRKFDSWPPKNTQKRALHLVANGGLEWEPPRADGVEAFDEYVSDPARPVPFSPRIALGMTIEHMLDDQRFAATRPDVLVYRTAALEEDLTFVGPLEAELAVSTTGTDSDWVVKLIDVYPGEVENPDPNPERIELGGYQQLVRGEVFRGKFRNSFSAPEPFEPGKVAWIKYQLPDVFHTFRRGHRIMIQIQSSWFPLVDRNPQTFCDIYSAREEDFRYLFTACLTF